MFERRTVETCQEQHLMPLRSLARVDVNERPRRPVRGGDLVGRGVDVDRRLVGYPGQSRHGIRKQILRGAGLRRRPRPALNPFRRVTGDLLLPEPGAFDSVGVALQRQRSAAKVWQEVRRDRDVVADQVALGDAVGRPEHLVQVRKLQLPPSDRPRASLGRQGVESFELGRRSAIRFGSGSARLTTARPIAASQWSRTVPICGTSSAMRYATSSVTSGPSPAPMALSILS